MHENGLDTDTVYLSWGLKIVSFSKSDELHLCALQQNKAVHTCALDSQDWLQNIAKKYIHCESIIHRWTKPGFHYAFLWNLVCPSAQSMSKNPFIERHMLSSTAVAGNVTPFNYVQSDIFPTLTFIRFHNFLTIHFIHILNLCANEMDTIVHALLMSEGRQHWHMLLEHANNNNNNALEEVQGKRTMCGLGSMYKQPEPVQLVYTWKNSLLLTTLSIRKFVSALF